MGLDAIAGGYPDLCCREYFLAAAKLQELWQRRQEFLFSVHP